MSLKDKAYRLFSYISQVYSIDLPVIRNISEHKAELWWQGDLIHSEQCKIKEFDIAQSVEATEGLSESLNEEAWLSVMKRQYDQPPNLPETLKDWINLSFNPNKKSSPKPSLQKTITFDSNMERVTAFEKYKEVWKEWKKSNEGEMPTIPETLNGWLEELQPDNEYLQVINEKIFEEQFEDNPARVATFDAYISGQWRLWSEKVLPLFKANILYDQLFSLHQRLDVEGDRIEIVWGHVFLSWEYNPENKIYYPLILTPMNLNFDPMRRHIFLTPSQTIPTKADIGCLQNLEYPLKDELIKFVLKTNDNESPPDVWSHNQMQGFASTITGLLSNQPAEKTNLYSDNLILKPPISQYPTIYNAPVIFIRERMRRLWVDDAKKIAEAVYNDANIPPFITSLVADPNSQELPKPEDYADRDITIDEDGGELLLPKEYNEQQEEVVKKLRNHFGALVQGPPGTGKSHTIANMVSSLLAQGKRVLVTSQTENALKVLREHIPSEIRSLCVSQLGNDTEAKRQLNEAVDAIGKRLADKNSNVIEQRIKRIKEVLRRTREEQAIFRNKIKDWVKLDAENIQIDNESISAVQAARECSDNEKVHSWFPDRITENSAPPLNENELIEMCSLLKEISSEDRKSCAQYLPLPELILSAEQFSEKILRLHSLSAIFAEAEELHDGWDEKLHQSQHGDIQSGVRKLEEALSFLHELQFDWQLKILEFIILEERQNNYWQSFLKKCRSLRESAWHAYQVFHGYEIEIKQNLPDNLDIDAALDDLNRRKPTNFFNRLILSKPAKQLYQSVKVDGQPLKTTERISAAKAYFSYHNFLRKL